MVDIDKATNNKYRIDARDYLKGVTGGVTPSRINILNIVIDDLNPYEIEKLRVEECADEHTGHRYGNARCRRGRAWKLGGGGRNKGDRYAYQIWAVWS